MRSLYARQAIHGLFCLSFALLLASCASVPQVGPQPVQSPNDDFAYRLLTLDNQMEVLLISDPDTPKAAASLDVMVGSGDNPPGRGGLAHFLEHMLFLGTDKYPDAAEYGRFLTEHGGSHNAYTSFENTNYFFDVDAAYLPGALDRFAQFFVAPRFDAQYVDREKNAVEAEFQMGLKSDARRGLDVLQEVMNSEHPYSQFSVGSLETLADRPGSTVREDLLRFYDQYYSANLMRLVVLGKQPLDELEALVTPMFAPVPNKSYSHDPIEAPLFAQGSLPMMVEVQPQATLRQLQVSFPVEDYRAFYDVEPLSYVSNLVGHEGEGSLLSQLKDEGLAESLAAGSGLSWRGGGLLSVNIALTEKGVDEYQRVLQLLFHYLEMLREEGPQEWLYQESSQLADLRFRFREQVEPISYVRAIATGMQHYRPEDVLRGPYMMTRFDQEMLAGLMERLVPENALVVLNDKHVETDRISNYYQVPYSSRGVSARQLAAWEADAKTDMLHLPAPNEFIAEDVALVPIAKDNPAVPTIALQLERQTVWFRQDDEFRLPKGATYINFRSPEVGQSPEQSAAAVLYTALVKDQVNEFSYPALLAGLNFSIYKHAQGISLRITGYNDKQDVLLQELLDAISQPTLDEKRFLSIRAEIVRGLRDSVAKRPSSQVLDDLQEALLYGEWGEQALIEALEELDQEDLRAYGRRFLSQATAETLVYGNYERRAVEEVAAMVAQIIGAEPSPVLPPVRVLKLAASETLQYAVDVPHDDAVVAWYLQGAGNDWEDRAATVLTAQIMKSGFFQQLRTEQQLGYVVSAFAWPQMDVPGLVMLVQSPVADADAITRAMQVFMEAVESDLDQEQFARHQAALVNEILSPDKNLWERAEFYWQSIAKKQYQFEGREALADSIQSFTMDSWLAYYNRVFLQNRHSLQVAAPGKWDKLPGGNQIRFDSAEAIKAGHDVYLIK
jgi:secreted Zn-dependent insulinase-like peptidase